MSYTARAKRTFKREIVQGYAEKPAEFYEKLAHLNESSPDFLARIKALKQKGITGWDAINQAVEDKRTEEQASQSQQEQGFNRVEIAFASLTWEQKNVLFCLCKQLAEARNHEFVTHFDKPLREFLPLERACIASAIKTMSDIRSTFGRNLERLEFHPKGAVQ